MKYLLLCTSFIHIHLADIILYIRVLFPGSGSYRIKFFPVTTIFKITCNDFIIPPGDVSHSLGFKRFLIFTVTNNTLWVDGFPFSSLGPIPRSGTLNHQTVIHWLIWGSPVKLLSKSFILTYRATKNVQEFVFASPSIVSIDFFFMFSI